MHPQARTQLQQQTTTNENARNDNKTATIKCENNKTATNSNNNQPHNNEGENKLLLKQLPWWHWRLKAEAKEGAKRWPRPKLPWRRKPNRR